MSLVYKMYIGERIVEVSKSLLDAYNGSGWLVSTGNLFLSSWQSVWCPSTEKLLEVLEQISNSKEGEPKTTIPEGCKLVKFVEEVV
jgi:hypothetical protein